MKKMKSRLMAGLLSMTMVFSVAAVPLEAAAATDTSGHWAESSINDWISRGYVSGYPDGTFRPDNPISRAEFVTIANKAFGFTSSQGISFSDVQPGYWAYSEIQKGVAAGYISGDANGTFRPGSAVSRQEAAVMLARLRGYSNDEAGAYNYTDRWAMANWAVGAIGAVSRGGIMSGYPDGTFKPQRSMTRAEAVASLQKVASTPNTTNNNTSYSTAPVYVTNNTTSSSSGWSSSGSSASNSTSSTFDGTVLDGTTLENRTLTKDLLIPSSVGRQTVTLKNIRMKGTLYVEGGREIVLDNCNIGKVVMASSNAVLKNNGNSDVEEVRFEERGRIDGKGYMNVIIDDNSVSEVIIDASVDTLKLDADVDVKLYANADIDTFEVTKRADNARISIGEDAEVMDMHIYDKVRISGKGKIDTMTVYVSGVKSEIEPRRLIQQDNAKKPNFSYDSSEDDDNDYDDLTLSDDNENFDGDGDRYNSVEINAEDVDVSNLTAYDDLTITSAARNSTIRLDNITVKGNVYVEGGGDSSVIFEDCDIEGNIYSRKNTSGRNNEAVAIKLRNTPVDGDIYISGDTLLESDEKLNKITINRELSKTVEIDASAKNIVIEKNNVVSLKGSHTIDNVEVISGLNNVTIIMNGGKITTLTARSPIKLEGSGSVDKLLTNQTNDIGPNITIGSTGTIEGGGNGSATSYTIAAASSGSGTISPSGEQIVTSGSTKVFTMTAAAQNHISSITVDGTAIDLEGKYYSGYTYTFNNVQANHEIIVYFAPGAGTDGTGSSSTGGNGGENQPSDPNATEFVITAKAGANGGIDPSGEVTVQKGAEQKFVITTTDTADQKYHIDTVKIDGEELIRVNERNYAQFEYTFKNVQAPHTIEATFAPGAGTGTGSMDSTMDNTSGNTGESGYYYNITASLYYSNGDKLYEKNGIYYCNAGETVQLKTESIDTNDPKYADGKLKLKWEFGGTSTAIKAEISETADDGSATLTTTAGSGYAVMLNLGLYDTEKGNMIAGSGITPISLHIDVPLNNNNGGTAVDGLRLTTSNSGTSLWTDGYIFDLASPTYLYNPTNATIAQQNNAKEQIIWEIKENKINGFGTSALDSIAIEDQSKNNVVSRVLVVNQYDDKGKRIEKPSGYVVVTATVPNGLGKGQNYVKDFQIDFTGGQFIAVTEILLPEQPKPYEFANITGINTLELNTIFNEVELDSAGIFVSPANATNRDVEWKIVDAGDSNALKDETDLGTIIEDTDGKKTILQTKGVPGEILLKAYVKNGKAEGTQDFTTDAQYDAKVTVDLAAVEVTAGSTADVGVNTDEGNTFILYAVATGSSPYVDVTGWQKRAYQQGQEANAGWQDVTPSPGVMTTPTWNEDEQRWESTYTVQASDLDTDKYNVEKVWEFRAVVPQNNGNVIYSDPVTVTCKGIPSQIAFPSQTDGGQVIAGSNPYTIKGFDKVTLPTQATGTGKAITWSVKDQPLDTKVAELNGNTLTVKGQNNSFTLVGEVQGEIKTEFVINTEFVPIESVMIEILDDSGLPVSSEAELRKDTEIKLKLGAIEPETASYFGYDSITQTPTWRYDITASGTGKTLANATTGFKPEDLEESETLYFWAVLPNGISDGTPAKSSVVSAKVNLGDQTVPVTGIDFSSVADLSDVTPASGASTTYTAKVMGKADSDVRILLSNAKVLPNSATSQSIKWTHDKHDSDLDSTIDINNVSSGLLIINQGTKAGTITLNAEVENGQSQGVSYKATLVITVEAAPISTSTSLPTVINALPSNSMAQQQSADTSNFAAVTDISFDSITGLQAPIAPATEYVTVSKSDESVVLNLEDSTTAIQGGATVRTGARVVPESATNKEIVWSLKEGTQTVPGVTDNIVIVPNIATLDTEKNTLSINPNTSGTLTLVATVKNGKAESGDNADFTKELTISISAPTQTLQSTTNTTSVTNTPSYTNTGSGMPVIPDNSQNHVNTGANMTQASKKQVISVGTTEVGTSSVSSAQPNDSGKNENGYAAHVPNNTPNTDIQIEAVGQCKKGTNIPLRAISKTTGKEYTDVEWEVTDDNNTNSKIVDGNKLRAQNSGVVTVTATVYTSSGEEWLRSINVIISK